MSAMLRLRLLLPALVLAAFLAPAIARAQTCAFSAGPTALTFGIYDPSATAPADSTASLSYTCSSARSRPVNVQLSAGGGGSYAPRQLASGADVLTYNLYSDSARSAIWGSDANPPYQWVASVPAGNTHGATLTIYGRIFVNQWVTPGLYSDTITVTLNF